MIFRIGPKGATMTTTTTPNQQLLTTTTRPTVHPTTTMTSTNAAAATTTVPWVERYRPKKLDQVAHQTEVVSTLQNAVKTGRPPHLLLSGPPGSGERLYY